MLHAVYLGLLLFMLPALAAWIGSGVGPWYALGWKGYVRTGFWRWHVLASLGIGVICFVWDGWRLGMIGRSV